METIRSATNPLIKRVRAVAAGREAGTLLLEGERLVEEALRRGLELDVLLLSPARASLATGATGSRPAPRVEVVTEELLSRLSGLKTGPGVLALARRPPSADLDALARDGLSLAVVAAGLQDPGNLGALARAAEAAGAGALIVLAGGCGPWNAKALRGSMGSLLRLPVARVATGSEVVEHLGPHGFRHVVAATRGGVEHERFDWTGRIALWFPGETGEDADVPRETCEAVSIAMAGAAESLNVSSAAAVLLFTARRARSEGP